VQPDAVWMGGSNAEALHLQSPELRPGSNGDHHPTEASNMVCSRGTLLLLLETSTVGLHTRQCMLDRRCRVVCCLIDCSVNEFASFTSRRVEQTSCQAQEAPPPSLASAFPMHASLDYLAPATAGAISSILSTQQICSTAAASERTGRAKSSTGRAHGHCVAAMCQQVSYPI